MQGGWGRHYMSNCILSCRSTPLRPLLAVAGNISTGQTREISRIEDPLLVGLRASVCVPPLWAAAQTREIAIDRAKLVWVRVGVRRRMGYERRNKNVAVARTCLFTYQTIQ